MTDLGELKVMSVGAEVDFGRRSVVAVWFGAWERVAPHVGFPDVCGMCARCMTRVLETCWQVGQVTPSLEMDGPRGPPLSWTAVCASMRVRNGVMYGYSGQVLSTARLYVTIRRYRCLTW